MAGQLPLTKACNGLGPFSPARRDIPYPVPSPPPPADPTGNFGFVSNAPTFLPPVYYTLRAPGGNNGNNGNNNNTSDICADRGITGQTGNFGLADPAGCGTNTPCYRDTIVNGSSNNCVELGADLPTTTGDKGINVQNGLQDRFAQDCIQGGAGNNDPPLPYADYLSATLALEESTSPPTDCGLWRRVIPVAINDGNIPNGQGVYNTVGMGCFYMPFPSSASPPSSNICLQFVGSCDETGRPTGISGGPSITKIVLFR